MDVPRPAFKCFDDDGRPKRSGKVTINLCNGLMVDSSLEST